MVSAKTAVSSEGLPREGPASQLLRMIIGRIQLLVTTAMRDSSYLLAIGQRLPSLPSHMVPSTGWVMTWQPVWSEQDYKRSQRERASKKHITVFITQSWIWHPTTFATFYLLKASHQVQPSFKGRAWIPGVRNHQEPCQKLSTASIRTPLALFFAWTLNAGLRTLNWHSTQPLPLSAYYSTYKALLCFFLANCTHSSGYAFQKLSVISYMWTLWL